MITSAGNQQIKNIAALSKKAKERKAQGVFIAEGPKMCFEAPVSWVKSVYVSESFCGDSAERERLEEFLLKAEAEHMKIPVETVADAVFAAASDTKTPQGVLALVKTPQYEPADLLKGDKTQLLILESIQDPGNLGTMLRTGEGAGITGVLMNRTTVDLFNPKTIRSTMGSIYRVPFVVADDFSQALLEIKGAGVKLYAAHLKGTAPYDEKDYTGACGFLIGNEGNGLSDEVSALADEYIRIPMEGSVESLNAAVSAAILTYECGRQRRLKHANLV